MSFEIKTKSFPKYSRTTHRDATGHSLVVDYENNEDSERGYVSLQHPTDEGKAVGQAIGFRGDRPEAAIRTKRGGETTTETVRQPSDRLRSLVANHHESPDQWPILLNALVEEYPEHFTDAVAAHTAARHASDATQYARAYTAAASHPLSFSDAVTA